MRRAILLSLVLLLMSGLACNSGAGPSARTAANDMPPFSEKFARDARTLYRLAWTDDGYPGRREADGSIYAHPLYGVYVIQDYLGQNASRPSARLRRAIRRMADSVLRRMDEHEGALVFWYEASEEFSRAYRRYYSGLTQSYYAIALHQAAELLEDESLERDAARVFDSLLVPAESGGVFFEDSHGISVAEVPQEPNSYILNGWLSTLYSVDKYAKLSGSKKAARLVDESSRALLALLPLYDVPALANSRYGLTGFLDLRLASRDANVALRKMTLTVPGEGFFGVPRAKAASKWQNRIIDDTRANVVPSRASFPELNELAITIEADSSGAAQLQAFVSSNYDPRWSAPTDEEWVTVKTFRVKRGRQEIRVPLPWEPLELVAYPTDFGKKVDGRHMNFYHSIHVTQLKSLADVTGNSEFERWSEKWRGYMCRWKDMEVYEGLWASIPDGRRVPVTKICA